MIVVNQRWQLYFPFIASVFINTSTFTTNISKRNIVSLFEFFEPTITSTKCIMPKYLAKYSSFPPIPILLSWHCYNHFNKHSSTSRNCEFFTCFRFKFPPAKIIKILKRIFHESFDLAKFRIAEARYGRN